MRRLLAATLLLLLLLPAGASAATRTQILRDCEDDSMLQGTYTRGELVDALSSIPTDVDAYGDCRDVLERARLDLAGANRQGQAGGKGAGPQGAATGGVAERQLPAALRSGGAGTAGRALEGATPEERAAVGEAATAGAAASVTLGGAVVRAPDAASSSLPLPLAILAGMLGAGLLAGLVSGARARLGRAAKG